LFINQILPPIERLCEPIEGTDRFRLAECLGMCLTLSKIVKFEHFLGLDPTRFQISNGADEYTFSALDAQILDAERSGMPRVRCRHCQGRRLRVVCYR
jgi:DNA polymerase alpha subunit A